MKPILILLIILILLVGGCASQNQQSSNIKNAEPAQIGKNETIMPLKISSTAFENNGEIPSFYTCDESNVSPPLKFEGVPEKAKSLVLIMDDPDAVKPVGKVWDHWVVFNIPPETKGAVEGRDPEGTMGLNSRNNLTYGGPCPPDGEHRYFFRLYALDTKLKLKEGATKAEVLKAVEGHIIEKAELIGKYKRIS